jgi:triacylglycerol lipase
LNSISYKCQTKYPIVLIHGTGFRDRKYLNYWGRIPKALASNGSSIFYGHQDSWATIENNAIMIKNSIEKIIAETGYEQS